jgi:hypothetical protein
MARDAAGAGAGSIIDLLPLRPREYAVLAVADDPAAEDGPGSPGAGAGAGAGVRVEGSVPQPRQLPAAAAPIVR